MLQEVYRLFKVSVVESKNQQLRFYRAVPATDRNPDDLKPKPYFTVEQLKGQNLIHAVRNVLASLKGPSPSATPLGLGRGISGIREMNRILGGAAFERILQANLGLGTGTQFVNQSGVQGHEVLSPIDLRVLLPGYWSKGIDALSLLGSMFLGAGYAEATLGESGPAFQNILISTGLLAFGPRIILGPTPSMKVLSAHPRKSTGQTITLKNPGDTVVIEMPYRHRDKASDTTQDRSLLILAGMVAESSDHPSPPSVYMAIVAILPPAN